MSGSDPVVVIVGNTMNRKRLFEEVPNDVAEEEQHECVDVEPPKSKTALADEDDKPAAVASVVDTKSIFIERKCICPEDGSTCIKGCDKCSFHERVCAACETEMCERNHSAEMPHCDTCHQPVCNECMEDEEFEFLQCDTCGDKNGKFCSVECAREDLFICESTECTSMSCYECLRKQGKDGYPSCKGCNFTYCHNCVDNEAYLNDNGECWLCEK